MSTVRCPGLSGDDDDDDDLKLLQTTMQRRSYTRLPAYEEPPVEKKKRPHHHCRLFIGSFALACLFFLSLWRDGVIDLPSGRGSAGGGWFASVVEHHQTIPTLLSVKDPTTNEYVYALENPLYDRLETAEFIVADKKRSSRRIIDLPVLHVDQTEISYHEPLTVSWTLGRDARRNALVTDQSVLVFVCGDDGDDDEVILDAATLGQVKTEAHVYRLQRFPIVRQPFCRFRLYTEDRLHDRFYLLAESKQIKVLSLQTPTAIHLALTSYPSVLMVNFVTASKGTPVVALLNDDGSIQATFSSQSSQTYTADDLCQAPANVNAPGKFQDPGWLHQVAVSDLASNVRYQYKVGLQGGQGVTWSDVYDFVAPPIVGSNESFSYLVYGDQGCPSIGWGYGGAWTAAMATREIVKSDSPIRAVHHFGDLAYAEGAAHVWDEWFAMIQPFATHVPLMIAVGNHEYDHMEGGDNGKDPSGLTTPGGFSPTWGNFGNDSGGECGVPTAKRFTMPANGNGVFWYSFDYASVHTIVLSSEHDLSSESRQYAWLINDLANVNRTKTPWVIVESHRPFYEGEAIWAQNSVGIGMRFEAEDLLRDYEVDLVLAGHYHAYHRTCDGLYRSKCNNGGPIHITVGSAGAKLDTANLYRNSWSAKLISGEYGYGRITVANASALLFEFVKAGHENETGAGDVHDAVWIQRQR